MFLILNLFIKKIMMYLLIHKLVHKSYISFPFSHVIMKRYNDLCPKAKILNVRWDFWKG